MAETKLKEFDISCRYKEKKTIKTIKAKNSRDFYIKNSPRTTYALESSRGFHPEMLDQIERQIDFMDRSELIESRNKSPIMGLRHKYSANDGLWNDNTYYCDGDTPFDHCTAWRKKSCRWPLIVLSEPYHFDEGNKKYIEEVTKFSKYRYRVFEPSKDSLWNEDCYMIFFWYEPFYTPNFDILMPNNKREENK